MKKNQKTFNLGWGNSIAVRQAFVDSLPDRSIFLDKKYMIAMDYPPHEGDQNLIELTKNIIFRQTGKKMSYVALTNGATGGVMIALRAFKARGAENCWTDVAPWFPLYPGMIRDSGLKHTPGISGLNNYVALIDTPRNPTGEFADIITPSLFMPIILDGVYFNNIYIDPLKKPEIKYFDCLVGSFSKLTGLNSVRVGWVATDDALLYSRIKELVTNEYAGISGPSMSLLNETLKDLDWDLFEKKARSKLDTNREEWSKLNKFFPDWKIPEVGMFHYCELENSVIKLFEKSNIVWFKGKNLGVEEKFSRFNLGADPKLISSAVKEVFKNDRKSNSK
jgi:aspartate/methionine/tyrosine aminotransferase